MQAIDGGHRIINSSQLATSFTVRLDWLRIIARNIFIADFTNTPQTRKIFLINKRY